MKPWSPEVTDTCIKCLVGKAPLFHCVWDDTKLETLTLDSCRPDSFILDKDRLRHVRLKETASLIGKTDLYYKTSVNLYWSFLGVCCWMSPDCFVFFLFDVLYFISLLNMWSMWHAVSFPLMIVHISSFNLIIIVYLYLWSICRIQ